MRLATTAWRERACSAPVERPEAAVFAQAALAAIGYGEQEQPVGAAHGQPLPIWRPGHGEIVARQLDDPAQAGAIRRDHPRIGRQAVARHALRRRAARRIPQAGSGETYS